MQALKSPKNVAFIVCVLAVIALQVYYVVKVRSETIYSIQEIQKESTIKREELIDQEKKLKNIAQIEEALEKITLQKNEAQNRIPSSSSKVKEYIELIRAIEANKFKDPKLQILESVSKEENNVTIIETKYHLSYISTYSQSRKFMETLNKSYQLLNISSFTIDNEIQTTEEGFLKYGKTLNEIVESTVEFSLFSLKDTQNNEEEEPYTPHRMIHSHVEDAFNHLEAYKPESSVLGEPLSETRTLLSPPPISTAQSFILNLRDSLVSGDNYSFLSPGPLEPLYTGLRSEKEVYITLAIHDEGYDITLEDEMGQVRQNSALVPFEEPYFKINSTIDKIKEEMPQIKIYIRNYTDQKIHVNLTGSLLETISVYDTYDEKLKPGESKGNVELT